MKRWLVLGSAVLVSSLVAGTAMAQPGGGRGQGGPGGFGGFGGGGTLQLLQNEEIRKELEITDSQVEKLEGIQTKAREQMREAFSGMRDLSDDERRERFAEMREKMETQTAAIQKDVDAVLLPHQVERLKQLDIQQQMQTRGASRALTSGALAKELNITDAQREELEKVQQEAQEDLRKKTEELRKAAQDKVLGVLTSDQRAKLKKLTGEPSNVNLGFQFGGGRGQGGPGGGGPGRGGQGGRGNRTTRPSEGD